MSLLIPSYKAGFARCAAESEYPGLWKGLVGLWAPHLGPTGLTLFDWSGYGNDGTLTSMAPATDWVTSPHGYVLDYDGTNDHVLLPNVDRLRLLGRSGTPCSVATWCRLDSYLTGGRALAACCASSNANGWSLNVYQDPYPMRFSFASAAYQAQARTSAAFPLNTIVHVAATYDGAKCRIYWDGVEQGLATDDSGQSSYTQADTPTIGANDSGAASRWDGLIGLMMIWDRQLLSSEIQQGYANPHAMLTQRIKTYATAVAPGGVAPTGNLCGPLMGPLGGAI